ncbi:MAG: PHP domain-containing protein [Spirochaetes bacterium]|nr:PHP domain-containing protein [Spirochaetota bacterium]
MFTKRFLFILAGLTVLFQLSCYFGRPRVFYFDGHIHTTHSDGSGSIADVKEAAIARGLNAVFVTNHAKQIVDMNEWNDIVDTCEALSDRDLMMIPSFEITGSESLLCRDHMLAWGVKNPFVGNAADALVPEEIWVSPKNPFGTGPMYPASFRQWSDWIHEQKGIAVHNHTTGTTQLDYNVDFIEVINMSHIKDIADFARQLGLGADDAWNMGLLLNSFSVYGDKYLQMPVSLPYNGGTMQLSLQQALYQGVGQWLGPNTPQGLLDKGATPSVPLNSWDNLLMAFINGEIDHPIYCVGNSDSHNTANTVIGSADYDDSDVGEVKNGVYLTHHNKAHFFDAVRRGNLFTTTGPSIYFEIEGTIMGETLRINTKRKKSVRMKLYVNSESASAVLVAVSIVKNGEVIHAVQPMASTYMVELDNDATGDCYYRVEVTSMESSDGKPRFAYANPVFIDRTGKLTGSCHGKRL